MICEKLQALLGKVFCEAYGQDLSINLQQRRQELWLVGLDTINKAYFDICGTIDPLVLEAINHKGYSEADAGYLANVQNFVPLNGKRGDLFFLNKDFFESGEQELIPLVVHELAHLLEQINEPPVPKGHDEDNAEAILKVLNPTLYAHHPREWALHLVAGARVVIEKRLTSYETIQEFLEAAIPFLDRAGEPILAK